MSLSSIYMLLKLSLAPAMQAKVPNHVSGSFLALIACLMQGRVRGRLDYVDWTSEIGLFWYW